MGKEMTKQDKLTKLIEIAIEQGWSHESGRPRNPDDRLFDNRKMYFRHLFDHDFAKAIWPGNIVGRGGHEGEEWWKHHLQQAVISDDPLEYYWENKA